MKRKRLRRLIGMDGSIGLDASEYRDASGGISMSEIFEGSQELQREAADAEAERRRVQDCRFGSTSKDAATIQTSRKNVTRTGIR